MLNCLAEPHYSTNILKALPAKLDIKRHLPSILYLGVHCLPIYRGSLHLSGSMIRKSRFIFTKEQRNIRQKSGSLKHSNERNFELVWSH